MDWPFDSRSEHERLHAFTGFTSARMHSSASSSSSISSSSLIPSPALSYDETFSTPRMYSNGEVADRRHTLRTSVHLQMPPEDQENSPPATPYLPFDASLTPRAANTRVRHPSNATTVYPEASTSQCTGSSKGATVLSLFQRRRTKLAPSAVNVKRVEFETPQLSSRRSKQLLTTGSPIPSPLWSPVSTRSSPTSSISSRIFSPVSIMKGAPRKPGLPSSRRSKSISSLATFSATAKRLNMTRSTFLKSLSIMFLLSLCLISYIGVTLPKASSSQLFTPVGIPVHSPSIASDSPQRDTLVLYRIIGNDLPPRHAPNQTLNNLRFLLANEHADFAKAIDAVARIQQPSQPFVTKVEKYYVLNRISSASQLGMVRALLAEFNVPKSRILDIAFEWEEYALRGMRWDGGVADVRNVWSVGRLPASKDGYAPIDLDVTNRTLSAVEATDYLPQQKKQRRKRAESIGRLRAIDFTFHDKNLYAMNNNGGRNFALAHGRSLPNARWILPLDGNCFLTPSAMASLLATAHQAGEGDYPKKHITIPMTRLLDNNVLIANNTVDPLIGEMPDFDALRPLAPEEPQVGFRFDSYEDFQEAMRYGRRSKLEFLWRLGAIPRSRDLDKRTLPWEQSDRDHLTPESFANIVTPVKDLHEAGYAPAGWTYRLFSGEPAMEINTPESNSLRNMNRIRGIVLHLERLDESITSGRLCQEGHDSLCGFSKEHTFEWDITELEQLREDYRQGDASAISRIRVVSAMTDSLLATNLSEVAAMDQIIAGACNLILAAFLTDDLELAERGVDALQRNLLSKVDNEAIHDLATGWTPDKVADDGEAYTFPHVLRVGIQPALWIRLLGNEGLDQLLPYRPSQFRPVALLDALRLLRRMPMRSPPSPDAVEAFLSVHLAWMLTDHDQLHASASPRHPHQALQYDYDVASLAAYFGDARLLNRVANRAHLRLLNRDLPASLRAALTNIRALSETHDGLDMLDVHEG